MNVILQDFVKLTINSQVSKTAKNSFRMQEIY